MVGMQRDYLMRAWLHLYEPSTPIVVYIEVRTETNITLLN